MSGAQGWSRENLAWLAGLLEGEGSFLLTGDSDSTRRYPRIQLGMTDQDVVEHAMSIAGCGSIYVFSQPQKKTVYIWRVQDQRSAYALMVALFPWMGARRQEAILHAIAPWLQQSAYGRRSGENHPAAKLSSSDVRTIRQRYAIGDVTQRTLAQEYLVSTNVMSRVVRNLTYQEAR